MAMRITFSLVAIFATLALCSRALDARPNSVESLAKKQCAEAPKHAEDRRELKSRLRFVHYNVEWLQYPEQGAWPTLAKSKEHTEVVANLIELFDADIMNFAELGDCESLEFLLESMNDVQLASRYRPYLLLGTDTSTNQNVGLISKIDLSANMSRTASRAPYPLASSKCCGESRQCAVSPQEPTTGVSKHAFSEFHIEGLEKPLLVVSLHLLAFPTDTVRCQKREAQANVIANVLENLSSSHSIIVSGDLNDYDPSVQDAAGIKPTSRVLDILKDFDPRSSGDELVNVVSMLDDTSLQVYSAWWDRDDSCSFDGPAELTLIDHILVSKDLVSRISHVQLLNTLYSPQTIGCNGIYSDHWPILVEFEL
jgi:exonuclease III